ncbi:MAG: hypothetical protein M4579_001347 [Chaenotheca gracillima]|nr:MAG: hypothetical protein M4579_001347 [Chaenotheca gracillima]
MGAGWTYSTDIWKLGVMIWNLIEDKDSFTNIYSSDGEYSAKAHLAKMIAFLGPPPKELALREKEGRRWGFRPAVENSKGELCETNCQFYGGPFMDAQGELMYKDLIPHDLDLSISLTSINGEDKRGLLRFARRCFSGYQKTGKLPKSSSKIHDSFRFDRPWSTNMIQSS